MYIIYIYLYQYKLMQHPIDVTDVYYTYIKKKLTQSTYKSYYSSGMTLLSRVAQASSTGLALMGCVVRNIIACMNHKFMTQTQQNTISAHRPLMHHDWWFGTTKERSSLLIWKLILCTLQIQRLCQQCCHLLQKSSQRRLLRCGFKPRAKGAQQAALTTSTLHE